VPNRHFQGSGSADGETYKGGKACEVSSTIGGGGECPGSGEIGAVGFEKNAGVHRGLRCEAALNRAP